MRGAEGRFPLKAGWWQLGAVRVSIGGRQVEVADERGKRGLCVLGSSRAVAASIAEECFQIGLVSDGRAAIPTYRRKTGGLNGNDSRGLRA